MGARKFFTQEQKESILLAISDAERLTSGEICVHLDTRCKGDQIERAIYLFDKLGMEKTRLKNGVLIYLAIEDRKLAIIGDEGINTAVPEGFWDEVRDLMIHHFREGDFVTGLTEGIRLAGAQLGVHFPRQDNDINELSNDISFAE